MNEGERYEYHLQDKKQVINVTVQRIQGMEAIAISNLNDNFAMKRICFQNPKIL